MIGFNHMKISKKIIFILLCCYSVVLRAETNTPILTLGITPQQSATELAKVWGPICQILSKQTGLSVQFKTSKDLNAFWADANIGKFDLIYINPKRYVAANKKQGYVVFAKDGGEQYVGIIVARKDGPKSLAALQGAQLAVQNLDAFAGAELPGAYLRKKGIKITMVAVGSHDSVYRTVEKGLYPAGASIMRIFGTLEKDRQDQFNLLWISDPLPPFAYAAHPRVKAVALDRVKQALLKMNEDAEGRALLGSLNIKEILSAKDSDYDAMRN